MSEVAIELDSVSFEYNQRVGARLKKKRVLDNVTFSIFNGETLGIVGRNGCGKSTMLKLLAGIYQPAAGTINTHSNRVSLQTLSAGFDLELSGHDNALLGAMLLGHSKNEARTKLDEIAQMAELNEAFFDPVKSYSSGMRARLGFATAVTMQTDVLLIDEVLGVGDAAFREKAEVVIHEKMTAGMTVVLVSHAAHQVKRLCHRVLWLENGRIKMLGDTAEVIAAYEGST